MSAIKIIQALGRKIAAKKAKTPEGITQIQPQIYAESEAGAIAQRLVDAGLPMERFDEFIFSEADLVRLLNQIEALEKKNLAESIKQGIRNTESAKVFDLKGRRIKDTDNIMGGEEMPPPGSRGGKDDIAAPVQSREETLKNIIDEEQAAMEKSYGLDEVYDKGLSRKVDMEASNKKIDERNKIIKANLEAQNKKGIAKIKQRQKMLDDAIEDASPGFANDIKYDAELVAENLAERMGLVYDDLPTKQRLDLYDQAYTGLSKQRFKKRPVRRESLEDFVDDAGGVDPDDPRGIDDFIPDDDPEPLAKGGIARIGLKDGMNRRTFLKIFSGLVSLPIIGKVLKPLKVGKTVTKVPIIKTDNVPGKPEWFDQLVNKVILEGDDVSKRFATKDREIVHMKKLDEDTTVRVTQDLDEGAVKVDYENPENVYGDPVQLRYKKPNPDEGDPRPSAEFDTAESGPVGRAFGPDDYEIEIDELGGTSISDLTSDVSKLKEYATGQKPTLKEIVQTKKRKDKAKAISEGGEDEMQAVIDRQGEFIQFDDVYPERDFAKGGIARMLGE